MDDVALSRTAVADAVRYLDGWFAFRQRLDRIPGLQVAILHDGEVVLDAAYGLADVESATPLTTSHLFRIASHSKTFTATAVFQLAEQGALRLDDPAGTWLPHLAGTPLGAVTIRELLAHGSGIVRDGHDGDFWQLDRAFPDDEALRRITLDDAAVLSRNERFKYSNIGYSMLGSIVAAASGRTYHEFVSSEIVDRLGLADTGPELDPARLAEYATGYTALGYADRRIPIDHIDTGAMAAATGFFSTARDVVRYAAAHFHGDDRLLGEESKRQMQRTEWTVLGGGGEYGLGLAVATVGKRRLLGHGGGYPGHITRTLFDPVDRLAVSVMTNAIDGPAELLATAAVRVLDLAQSASEAPKDADADADLTAFAGRFAGLWGVFDLVDLGGRVHQVQPGIADPFSEPMRLDVVDADTLRYAVASGYASPGELLRYDRGADGRIRSVRGGSGSTSYPIDDFAAALADHDRVRIGSPVRPGR